MSTNIVAPAYLSVLDLAKYLDVSRHTAYALVRGGSVPSVRVGGQYRIPLAELERQLAEQVRRGGP